LWDKTKASVSQTGRTRAAKVKDDSSRRISKECCRSLTLNQLAVFVGVLFVFFISSPPPPSLSFCLLRLLLGSLDVKACRLSVSKLSLVSL
jgi:hypothetical protein